MHMKKLLFLILALVVGLAAGAQNADKLYTEGKALYDKKHYTEAFPKLKAAAEKGHKKAQYRLGRCYDKGHGVAEDNRAAFQWYKKSAAQNFAKAQYQLGRCYKKGKGVTADAKEAKSWFSKAVNNPKGGDKLVEKLRESAAEGDESAQEALALVKK